MASRRSAHSKLGSDLVYGALAGAVGAACMTPLRILARRAGLIEKMTPEVMEETLAYRLGVRRGRREEHHVADHLLHLGYGCAQGALFGLVARRFSRASSAKPGLLFGALSWLVNGAVVVPLLDATRPLWRQRPRENLVNLAAHLIFGAITGLVTDDLAEQHHHRPTTNARRWFTSVG
jgi:hypothetical protein